MIMPTKAEIQDQLDDALYHLSNALRWAVCEPRPDEVKECGAEIIEAQKFYAKMRPKCINLEKMKR